MIEDEANVGADVTAIDILLFKIISDYGTR